MKKLNKLTIIALLGILLFSFNLIAATKAPPMTTTKEPEAQIAQRVLLDEKDMFRTVIFAGRNIFVGYVDVWSEAQYVYVKYTTTTNWFLTETHLHLAMDWRQIPQTRKGNPIPGHFAHQMEHNFVTEYTYQIPLNDYKGIPRYGAAHCELVKIVNGKKVQEETGWGKGYEFPGRNWAWYFEITN